MIPNIDKSKLSCLLNRDFSMGNRRRGKKGDGEYPYKMEKYKNRKVEKIRQKRLLTHTLTYTHAPTHTHTDKNIACGQLLLLQKQ